MTTDCIFCKIVAGEIPATIVYRDDQATAFRDMGPKAPVHVLIVPNRHIAGMDELQEGDADLIGRLVLAASQVARVEGLAESGYRLVFNSGPDAGQSVFHIHLHLLGGRPLAWPPG